MDEDTIWSQLAFPSYLQSRESHKKGVCRDFDKAIAAAERKQGADASFEEDLEEEDPAEAVWLAIRYSKTINLSCKQQHACMALFFILHPASPSSAPCASVGTRMKAAGHTAEYACMCLL